MNWLREIEERCEKATPVYKHPFLTESDLRFDYEVRDWTKTALVALFFSRQDAEAFIKIRTDIPRLINLVKEMEAALRFYAVLAPFKPTHPCNVDVRFQIDGGDIARDVLKRFEGEK